MTTTVRPPRYPSPQTRLLPSRSTRMGTVPNRAAVSLVSLVYRGMRWGSRERRQAKVEVVRKSGTAPRFYRWLKVYVLMFRYNRGSGNVFTRTFGSLDVGMLEDRTAPVSILNHCQRVVNKYYTLSQSYEPREDLFLPGLYPHSGCS